MRPRDVLTAAVCVLCWTAPKPAAQDSRLPFDVDQPSAEERPQHRLHEVGIGIRDRHGDCGDWLVDLLVPIGKRFVHVSSTTSTRAAPIAVKGILVMGQSVCAKAGEVKERSWHKVTHSKSAHSQWQ